MPSCWAPALAHCRFSPAHDERQLFIEENEFFGRTSMLINRTRAFCGLVLPLTTSIGSKIVKIYMHIF